MMNRAEQNSVSDKIETTAKVSNVAIPADIPHDPALPGLQTLLSVEIVAWRLAEHFSLPVDAIQKCEITYIRYKPGTNCLIAYRALVPGLEEIYPGGGSGEIMLYGKVYADADYANARTKALSHRWMAVGTGESGSATLTLNKQRAILYFFPNDCLLEGLRILSGAKKVQRLLYDWHGAFPEKTWRISDRRMRFTPVRYKPERRAVLRCQTRATGREDGVKCPLTVYLRIYSDKRGADVYSLMKRLYDQARSAGDVTIPRPLGYDAERGLLMMEGLEGAPLNEIEPSAHTAELFARVGVALAGLHRLTVPELGHRAVADIIEQTLSSGASLEALDPELADLISSVRVSLSDLAPDGTPDIQGFTHGDFHQGQTLVTDSGVGIIDFDRSYVGDQYADIGEWCAHLKLQSLRGEIAERERLQEAFVAAYENNSGHQLNKQRLAFWISLRLFSQAVGPFRRLETDWRIRAREILEECLKLSA